MLKSFSMPSQDTKNPGFWSFSFAGDSAAVNAMADAPGLLGLSQNGVAAVTEQGSEALSTSNDTVGSARYQDMLNAQGGGRRLAVQKTGDPPYYAFSLDRIDQPYFPLDDRYNFDETGKNVRLYVLSGGIDLKHPEFGGRAYKGYDFVTPFGSADSSIECSPGDLMYDWHTRVCATAFINAYAVAAMPCSASVETAPAFVAWSLH